MVEKKNLSWKELSVTKKSGIIGFAIGIMITAPMYANIEAYEDIFKLITMPAWIIYVILAGSGILPGSMAGIFMFTLVGMIYGLMGIGAGIILKNIDKQSRTIVAIVFIGTMPIIIGLLLLKEHIRKVQVPYRMEDGCYYNEDNRRVCD